MENEFCENCGRTIGKLEQAYVYKGHVVCKQCYKYLHHEPQKIPSAQAKNRRTNLVRVIGILSIAVIIVVILSIFINRALSSPLRGMTFAEVEQFVRAWNAGELPGMKLCTKEQLDRLAEAESELAEITRGEYEAWHRQQNGLRQRQYAQQKQQGRRGGEIGYVYTPFPRPFNGLVTESNAFGFARLLKEKSAASQSLLAQLEIVEKLRDETPVGPSWEVWEKYDNKDNPGRRSLLYPVTRGVDQSRAMFYRTFGKPYDTRKFNDKLYFYYRCKNGAVELTLLHDCFNLDAVVIFSVNTFF